MTETKIQQVTFTDEELANPEMVKVKFLTCFPALVGSNMYTYGPFNKHEILDIPYPNAKILAKEEVIEFIERPKTLEQEHDQELEPPEDKPEDKPEELDTVDFSRFTVYPAKIMITGSRSITDKEWVYDHLNFITRQYNIECFVVGDASGIDSLVQAYGKDNEIHVKERKVLWDLYGKAAGPIRNSWMVKECDFGLGLWDGESSGTKDALEKLKTAGKLMTVFLYKKEEPLQDIQNTIEQEEQRKEYKKKQEKEKKREQEKQKKEQKREHRKPRRVRKVHPQWTIAKYIQQQKQQQLAKEDK